MFDRLLLGRLWADRRQTWWEGWGRVRKGSYGTGFHGNLTAFTVNRKRSHCSHIGLMVLIFLKCSLLDHVHLLAENERNLPHGFRDRPIATAWQPSKVRMRLWRDRSRCICVTSRLFSMWRHAIFCVTFLESLGAKFETRQIEKCREL